MEGIFGEFFLVSVSHEAKHEKSSKNSEQNSGQNPGRKIEKFGKLSFCNFQKTFRYLWRFCSLLFRGFFVALFCLETQCLGLFRGFFVAPRFGQILRVLALEQSSETFLT